MNHYRMGLIVVPHNQHAALEKQAYRTGVQVGALIATPGFIKDQVNQLDGEFHTTDTEVWTAASALKSGPLYQWYLSTWAPLMDSWRHFHDQHQGFFDNFWGSTMDNVNDYKTKLIAARNSFRNIGGALTSPDPTPPAEGWMAELGHAITGVGHFVKNVTYVLLFAAGAFILYKVYIKHTGGM